MADVEPTCPGHDWMDITTYADAARRFMCSRCGREREEPRPAGDRLLPPRR